MKTMRSSLGMLPPAALAVFLIAATAPADAAGRQAVPREGDAPQVRVESGSSSSSSGGAVRTRPSSPSSRGSSGSSRGSGTVSRTRPPSGSGASGAPTRVDRNPDRYRRYYNRPYRYRYYDPYFSASFYLGYYPPYYYWPWGYWGAVPLYYPAYHPRYYGGSYYGADAGALDLDVSPEKAEVWLDGRYVGVADQFDGFPEYLWLPEGTYDVIFYKEGYQTIHRQYSIYPGVVIDVEDRMLEGDSVRPEELAAPKTTVRREERLRRDEERRQEVEDRDRMTRRNGEPFDARGEPGRLRLDVRPDDASVYLDGRFLGTAEELANLHSSLIVDPGEHRLEVVRPGYESDQVEFEVAAGEEVSVTVTLEEG